jgi:hypothetical protein
MPPEIEVQDSEARGASASAAPQASASACAAMRRQGRTVRCDSMPAQST